MSKFRMHILVCGGTGCMSSSSGEIFDVFEKELSANSLSNEVQVIKTGCFGFCEQGPIVKIYPDNVFYVQVKPADVSRIISEHVIKGRTVPDILYKNPESKETVAEHREIPFYHSQLRIALRNCGLINPEEIDDYISVSGYEALGKCLTEISREDVISAVKASGLRGRGGAGVSTGFKWEMAYKSQGDKKYVICNADEGDPGAFMDRSILEGDPHSVLEAMAICGYAIGADEGVIYIRAEYPLAVERLRIAIRQAEEYGLLGDDILGSGFSFHISLSLGAGAFVCGEETALMNSVQGMRGEPRMKPPFPAQAGLWHKPSNVNNVETWANIPPIILKGADWFKSIGTEKSPGTKVFALAGQINNVGLVEVPMGIKLRDIIYKVGGGVRGGKRFKAVQTGGPSGGCIPAELLDLAIDYDSLQSVGSMMGSGGMIVMDETDCMVNIAKYYLEFTVEESCGKCTPCRIGNRRLLEILEKITSGQGTEDDLTELKDLSAAIQDSSLCALGQTAPNPVVSTMKYFWDEYIAHVRDKKCTAGKCTSMLTYKVTDKCIGCTICAKNCPVNAISGSLKSLHSIDPAKCVKCGVCFNKCPKQAIERV
ncbi:MAG: NADH-quinone oxidoreductase subunit NuoF [Clostridiales bacterium]|jgi:NADH:ubiquinone oxidoreductase subunit F (NADH-binding)/(2Fe-2S) ferredoxin/NAD-dependent dihydropyrimidine dehydrogenase PreA subunit|nr:NADH-quinone oxidoreductase subunit NuoF [Clostridiales bacterium]